MCFAYNPPANCTSLCHWGAKMVYYSSLRSPKPISTALTLLFLPDPCPCAPKETQYCRALRFLCHIWQCTQGFATPWGGVGQWWRSFGLNHVVDATPRIGVGWGGTVLHALAFYRKERMSRIGCEPKKSETWARTKTGWRCDAKTK